MVAACLLCASLILQTPPAADMAEYQEARARAGRDPDSQVALALWCEARGLEAERLKHLTLAVLLDPNHQAARGLLGQVAHEGKWKRPEEVRAAEEAVPEAREARREYLDRRARTADEADAQQRLARWCEEKGLDEQAAAHYRAVVRLAPGREAVWRRLGYEKRRGVWGRPADFLAAKAEAEAQKDADKFWKPRLEKHRAAFLGKDPEKRRDAETALDLIEDPRAVPMLWAVFIRDDARLQARAAGTLARIEGATASQALASLAVFSDFAEVRGRSADFLKNRDPREFVGPLLELIHKPFRYKLNPDVRPESDGQLYVEGERFNVDRRYRFDGWAELEGIPRRVYSSDVPLLGGMDSRFLAVAGNYGGVSAFLPAPAANTTPISIPGAPGMTIAAATPDPSTAALVASTRNFALQRDLEIMDATARLQAKMNEAQVRMRQDEEYVEQLNRRIREVDDRVLPIVKAATGRDFGDDQDAWKSWWTDQLGAVYDSKMPVEKPTYTEFVWAGTGLNHHACFVAGTPVHTSQGLVPIETLRVGDRVLSQDVESGRISYQTVEAVHRNEASPTFKLDLGGETLVATGIHRFWKAGQGWTMARELKPGDQVRALGGTLSVVAVEPASAAPVFNLEVSENRDFFVGGKGVLVYDYSLARPTEKPFDAPASSEPAGRR